MAENGKRKDNTQLLEFYRRFFLYFLLVVVLVIYFVFMFWINFVRNTCNESQSLLNIAVTEAETDRRIEKINSLYTSMYEQSARSIISLVQMQYAETDITPGILEELNEMDSNTYFFMNEEGSIVKASETGSFDLDESELLQLKEEKELETDSERYFLEKCGNGFIIAQTNTETESVNNSLSRINYCDGLFYDTETQEILDVYTDSDELTEQIMAAGSIDNLEWWDLSSLPGFNRYGIRILAFSTEDTGAMLDDELFLAVRNPEGVVDGIDEYLFSPMGDIVLNTLTERIPPLLMLIVFAVFSVMACGRLRKEYGEGCLKGNRIRLFGRYYADSSVCINTLVMQLCVGLLIIAAAALINSLWHFTVLHEQAESYLESLSESFEEREKAGQELQSRFEEQLITEAEICAGYLEKTGMDPDSRDGLIQIKEQIGADDISVFDKNGMIICSTGDYTGYKLSRMEDDGEYNLWKLLEGEEKELVYQEEDGITYCGAVRRKDGIGLVRIEQSNTAIRSILKEMNIENVLRLTSFGSSDKLYAMQSNPDILYRIRAGSNELETLDNILPKLGNLKEYTGFAFLDGDFCFVNGKGNEKIILYNADAVKNVLRYVELTIGSMGIACLIMALLVLAGTMVPENEIQAANDENSSIERSTGGEIRKNKILNGVYAVLAVSLLLLAADYLTTDNSILYFLFMCGWNKGVNIFSAAAIMLSLILVAAVLKLLKKFFGIISDGLPSHTATIMQMINSVLNVMIVIWFILSSLGQLGINTQTIIAGIGVTGLAIGIGAKDTISDLVAGVFIILDGNIRVGDIVKVNSFYGQVVHMGVRTTKIRLSNQEISIHNAAMNNVVNCSMGNAKASVNFCVPFEIETDRIRGIIEANKERFRSACGDILLDDVVLTYLTDFDAEGGVCYEIAAHTEEINRRKAVYRMNEVLKKIMEENHIEVRGSAAAK